MSYKLLLGVKVLKLLRKCEKILLSFLRGVLQLTLFGVKVLKLLRKCEKILLSFLRGVLQLTLFRES